MYDFILLVKNPKFFNHHNSHNCVVSLTNIVHETLYKAPKFRKKIKLLIRFLFQGIEFRARFIQAQILIILNMFFRVKVYVSIGKLRNLIK